MKRLSLLDVIGGCWLVRNASNSSLGRMTFQRATGLAIFIVAASFVQSQSADQTSRTEPHELMEAVDSFVNKKISEVLNVQPANIKHGDVILYGIIRELPEYPLFDGTVLAIQVTASESGLTTESRRDAQGGPCAVCTTMHYFLVSEENERRPEVLYRMAPGPVTYIHIDKKEYMMGRVDLDWEGEKPHLKKVTLLQTGFAPPLFKRRINIRFEDSIEVASEAKKIANMALRDAFAYMRPTTLRKVFPPESFSEVVSDPE